MSEALQEGHIAVRLQGRKLKGGYGLVRMKGRGRNNWLLVKMDDEEADLVRAYVDSGRCEIP